MADEKTSPSGGEALAAAGGIVSAEKLAEITKGKGTQPGAAPVAGAPEAGKETAPAQKVQPRGGDAAAAAAEKEAAEKAAAAGQAPAGEKVEPIVVKTPFGTSTYGAKEQGEKGEITLSSFEDVQAFAKANELEIKEVNDLQSLIKEYGKMKQSVNQLGGLQSQVETYERTLKSLPTDVSLILDAALKNQDYSQVIQNIAERGALDFERPFSKYNDHDLINHYNDEKFTTEQFKEMESGQFDALKKLAKTRYETDQAEYKAEIVRSHQALEAKQTAFDHSVEASIAQLRTNNPDMGEAEIKRVREIMTGDLQNTLFESDGVSYKPEAAERIAMQEYGKEAILAQAHTIGDLVTKFTNQGVSQANEAILSHSDKRPLAGTASGGADDNVISEVVKKQTSFIHARG